MCVAGVSDVRQLVTVPQASVVHIWTTLCRFDHKPMARPHLGPFIPCERRLAIREILEIQGRDFRDRFLKWGLWQAS